MRDCLVTVYGIALTFTNGWPGNTYTGHAYSILGTGHGSAAIKQNETFKIKTDCQIPNQNVVYFRNRQSTV